MALVKMPYTGARNVSELSVNPDHLERGGLASLLANKRVSLRPTSTVRLTAEKKRTTASGAGWEWPKATSRT